VNIITPAINDIVTGVIKTPVGGKKWPMITISNNISVKKPISVVFCSFTLSYGFGLSLGINVGFDNGSAVTVPFFSLAGVLKYKYVPLLLILILLNRTFGIGVK